ncbi:MAG: nicotinate-nucleotide adenylyltransferase [Clostridia bacterium]
MKLGIYGGTFDPVHKEHVNIANASIEELGLDKLIVLPIGEPPHKSITDVTEKKKRLKMCELAFDNPKIEISTYEMDKKGKSYTCETLEHFSADDVELYCIIGGDSLADIYTWKNPDEIFALATIVVVGREDYAHNEYIRKYMSKIIKLKYEPKDISSTEVRIRCQFGQSIDELVSEKVVEYINEHELYSEYRKMTKKVQKMISEARYIHSMNTTICGVELAKRAGVEPQTAFIACALHDCAKGMTDYTEFKKKLKKEDMFIPEPVIHAFVASYIIKSEFGINDKDIKNAIKYHTTGRPNMSQLEKLVYVADCIEKGRVYPGVEELRQASKKNFERTFILCLNSTFSVVIDKTMCPLTLDAIDFYGR